MSSIESQMHSTFPVLESKERISRSLMSLFGDVSRDSAPQKILFKGPVVFELHGQTKDTEGTLTPYHNSFEGRNLIVSGQIASPDIDCEVKFGERGAEIFSAMSLQVLHVTSKEDGNTLRFTITYSSPDGEQYITIRCSASSSVDIIGITDSNSSQGATLELPPRLSANKYALKYTPNLNIALNVVRRVNADTQLREYLLVMESSKHIERAGMWYFPAGKAKNLEDIYTANDRETLEEGGVTTRPLLLLGVDQILHESEQFTRTRFIFLSEQVGSEVPKSISDEDSEQARWFTLEEIKNLPLRSLEVLHFINLAESGLGMPLDQLRVLRV